MPEAIHERARHLLAKNPDMKKSTAFAVATQQMEAVGKTPKGFGTAEGKRTAKAKYDTPGDDVKTPNPGNLSTPKLKAAMFAAFEDELQKIAGALPKDDASLGNSMADLAMRQSAARWAIPTAAGMAIPGALVGTAIGTKFNRPGAGALIGGGALGLLGAHQALMAHGRAKAYATGKHELQKTALAVTEKGHQFDAERNRLLARQAAELAQHEQGYNALAAEGAPATLGGVLRFGASADRPDAAARHLEYVAKMHEAGSNAWNPLGGLLTPSSFEQGGTRGLLSNFGKSVVPAPEAKK